MAAFALAIKPGHNAASFHPVQHANLVYFDAFEFVLGILLSDGLHQPQLRQHCDVADKLCAPAQHVLNADMRQVRAQAHRRHSAALPAQPRRCVN